MMMNDHRDVSSVLIIIQDTELWHVYQLPFHFPYKVNLL